MDDIIFIENDKVEQVKYDPQEPSLSQFEICLADKT